ncbi:heterokaryon incompatibility protein-domain-containing protein [Podospora aff. communis PSN243]|uniref:Heterokaryon incompatibility protein-domain-containing protein n=1 Tax=Podospora aff. communis PSN243 TaxID=3040156 RepID=A0AAV9GP71_9PEZI|nr:heterokaryon incompatibility protein-domain-containing protein [Podospora aff. communis PSN243]
MEIYEKLESNAQSIRLFRISTGLADKLELELEVFCLESPECPPFASLSYMWGTDDPCHDIRINDSILQIRPNAFLFLDTLRKHQQRRIEQGLGGLPRGPDGGCVEWIWMDSICINQSDPNERNHQVGLMRKIYGLAEHVIFHIGPDAAVAQRWMDGRFPDKNKRTLEKWAKNGWPQHILRQVAKDVNESDYAKRLWVVQELVLGRHVSMITADWIIPFSDLAEAGALGNVEAARQRWHRDGVKGSPLVPLLKSYKKHRCKETVDKVFGLLGICSEKIPVDYNLPAQSVIIEVLAYFILKEPNTPVDEPNPIPYEMNRTRRIADALRTLQTALRHDLRLSDFATLLKRLEQAAEESGTGKPSDHWWYSSTAEDLQSKFEIKYGWNTGYDSTAGHDKDQSEASVPFLKMIVYNKWFFDPLDDDLYGKNFTPRRRAKRDWHSEVA